MSTIDYPVPTAAGHGSMPGVVLGAGESHPRWAAGERLRDLFEGIVDQHGDWPAVELTGETWSYGELDERANRLARYLLAQGVESGDRVGLLFSDALLSYVGMLAVLKVHAAYVPLDASSPPTG